MIKNAINKLYLDVKRSNNVLPLVYDFLNSSGKIGLLTIEKRVKSEIVLVLAIIHHLLLSQDVDIDDVFRKLKKFASKYVIVEFMSLGLYSGDDKTIPVLPKYYNLNWFRTHFEQNFKLIYDESLEKNRHIFIGEIN